MSRFVKNIFAVEFAPCRCDAVVEHAADCVGRHVGELCRSGYVDSVGNERHYGALQGLNKTDTANKFGAEQVHEWRRSFDERPPLLTKDDPRWPGNDPRYRELTEDELPLSESLHDTIARVRCCWEERIVPALRCYDSVMVVAHGNSLRAMIMMLRHLTAEEIQTVELPTGSPLVIDLDERIGFVSERYL